MVSVQNSVLRTESAVGMRVKRYIWMCWVLVLDKLSLITFL